MTSAQIRKEIGKYYMRSITGPVLNVLKNHERKNEPFQFWHYLLLLKWAMEFAEENRQPRIATNKDIVRIIEMIHVLEITHPIFKKGTIHEKMSLLAGQQMCYQEKPWLQTFAMQARLYDGLMVRYDIAQAFFDRTGLSIREFLNLMKTLFVTILQSDRVGLEYPGILTVPVAMAMIHMVGEEKFGKFIKLMSVSPSDIKNILREDPRARIDYDLEVYAPSFFVRKPLLSLDGVLVIPHRNILNYTINHFIYDYLKNKDASFSEEFGQRMERYLRLGLDENDVHFQDEDQLRRVFGKDKRVVDYFVEGIVLVEAKAIELRPGLQVNPRDEYLGSEFIQSLVKAYAVQMLSVVQMLPLGVEYFGLVVTYKKIYLGDSLDFWSRFLHQETLKVVADPLVIERLPFQNLFFIDVATWDRVMQIMKTYSISLKDVLLAVKTSTEKERKFGTDMHLDQFSISRYDLDYLRNLE